MFVFFGSVLRLNIKGTLEEEVQKNCQREQIMNKKNRCWLYRANLNVLSVTAFTALKRGSLF